MRPLKYVFAALVAGALAVGPLPAALAALQAPPAYQSSEPSKGEMMDAPPTEVTVTFDQPLDQSSWMNVMDECGREIDSGPATIELNEMTVGIGKTPAGTYEVVYKAVGVGGVTGSSGSSFDFMVHDGKQCKGGKKPPHHHDDPKKKDHGKGHDDHPDDDHGDHEDGGTGHTGHSDMTGTSASGHTGHTGPMDTMDTMDHGDRPGGGHGEHGPGHEMPPVGGADDPTLAGGTTGGPVAADAQAVLVALGLALAVGALGGALLRMSAPSATARG